MFYYLSKTIERPCISLGYLSLKSNLIENKNNSVNITGVILKIKCHKTPVNAENNSRLCARVVESCLNTNMEFLSLSP